MIDSSSLSNKSKTLYSVALKALHLGKIDVFCKTIEDNCTDLAWVSKYESINDSLLTQAILRYNLEAIRFLLKYGIRFDTGSKIPRERHYISLLFYIYTNKSYTHEENIGFIRELIEMKLFFPEEQHEWKRQFYKAILNNDIESCTKVFQDFKVCSTTQEIKAQQLFFCSAIVLAYSNRCYNLIDWCLTYLKEIERENALLLQQSQKDNEIVSKLISEKSISLNITSEQSVEQLKILQRIADLSIDNVSVPKALHVIEKLLEQALSLDQQKNIKQRTYKMLSLMYSIGIPYERTDVQEEKDPLFSFALTQVLYGILEQHGFDTSARYYFYGFIPNDTANKIAKKTLFMESIAYSSIAHGIYSHLLQVSIIGIWLDLGIISAPGYDAHEVVNIIINRSKDFDCYLKFANENFSHFDDLWPYLFDSFYWYPRYGSTTFSYPHAFNAYIMNSRDDFPILGGLLCKTTSNKLKQLCTIINQRSLSNQPLTTLQLACAMTSEGGEMFGVNDDMHISIDEIRECYVKKAPQYPTSMHYLPSQNDDQKPYKRYIVKKESNAFNEHVTLQRTRYQDYINFERNKGCKAKSVQLH